MSRLQRICPACSTIYAGGEKYCPTDKSKLEVHHPDGKAGRVGEVIDGKYRLDGLLGAGGMGEVYLAHQKSMNREVALKLLGRELAQSEGLVARFLREAEAMSRLAHPHVITVFDFGREPEPYLVMELLRGLPLTDLIRTEGALPVERALDIAGQLCEALDAVHDLGVIHRDVKPDNVFVLDTRGKRDFVKLLDFGIAKLDAPDAQSITGVDDLCGTPQYMSPEQAGGEPVGTWSDVYSLGVVLFELLTGVRPFRKVNASQILVAHLLEPPPTFAEVCPAADIPVAVEAVVMRALAKSRAVRPSSASELLRLLEDAAHGRSVSPPLSVARPSSSADAFADTVARRNPRAVELSAATVVAPRRHPPAPPTAPATPNQLSRAPDEGPAAPPTPRPPLRRVLLGGLAVVLAATSVLWASGALDRVSFPTRPVAAFDVATLPVFAGRAALVDLLKALGGSTPAAVFGKTSQGVVAAVPDLDRFRDYDTRPYLEQWGRRSKASGLEIGVRLLDGHLFAVWVRLPAEDGGLEAALANRFSEDALEDTEPDGTARYRWTEAGVTVELIDWADGPEVVVANADDWAEYRRRVAAVAFYEYQVAESRADFWTIPAKPGRALTISMEALQKLRPSEIAFGGAYLNVCHAYFDIGEAELARVKCLQAAKLTREGAVSGEAHYLLGLMDARAGDRQAALTHLREASRLLPPGTDNPVVDTLHLRIRGLSSLYDAEVVSAAYHEEHCFNERKLPHRSDRMATEFGFGSAAELKQKGLELGVDVQTLKGQFRCGGG